MVEHPEPTEGVLDEVADDPVWREELGGCGDLVGASLLVLLEAGEDLVFALGDIELVEPTDHLYVLADLLGQHLDCPARDRVVGEQVGRDEQLCEVAFALEHERHGAVPVAAVVRKQQGVGLALGVVATVSAVEQCCHGLAGLAPDHVGLEVATLGLSQDLGLTGLDAGLRGDDADAGVAARVHEAQGDDPVEPGVSDLVSDGSLALIAPTGRRDGLLEGFHCLGLLDPLGRGRGQHNGDPGGHFADERGACPRGERLQWCGFHQSEIRFPSFRVFTSAERRASR
ncbi:hypothetical protein SDC9_106746 [bioreactor metagenome]|uniref:Uncharacterized protein n=1 Tax=bioreactor metagenome TaxID=1076179 RepID=A0A645B358_9ZZZZ